MKFKSIIWRALSMENFLIFLRGVCIGHPWCHKNKETFDGQPWPWLGYHDKCGTPKICDADPSQFIKASKAISETVCFICQLTATARKVKRQHQSMKCFSAKYLIIRQSERSKQLCPCVQREERQNIWRNVNCFQQSLRQALKSVGRPFLQYRSRKMMKCYKPPISLSKEQVESVQTEIDETKHSNNTVSW